MKTLIAIHTYKRPRYSETDEEFLDRFFRPLSDLESITNYEQDDAGNLIFEVSGGSKTMFTAHSDTVHTEAGRQSPALIGDILVTPDGEILGADDGAGLWIVREIMLAGLPCYVVVTRGEEGGGIRELGHFAGGIFNV
jgi:hypothetical protein